MATAAPLVGIAALAARAPVVRQKRQVSYHELPTRTILNRSSNPDMPFDWTINPYRGCEFGCKYCYARYTHEFMGLNDGVSFENRIYAKAEAAAILRRDLSRPRFGSIAIGTATDPYQPAERNYGVTRALLEVFSEGEGRQLSITTKSDLVTRDVELLLKIRERNQISVNVTVTTTDVDLARKLEPRAPRPDLRLSAVNVLADAGLAVGVFANPVMPMITDGLDNLNAVAKAAAAAGAGYFGGGTLFFMPSTKQQFFPFLDKEFPELRARYQRRYENEAYLKGDYAEKLRDRMKHVRSKNGLSSAPDPARLGAPPAAQLSLF